MGRNNWKVSIREAKSLEGWDRSLTTGLCSFSFLRCPCCCLLAWQTNPSPVSPLNLHPPHAHSNSTQEKERWNRVPCQTWRATWQLQQLRFRDETCSPPGSWITTELEINRKHGPPGPGTHSCAQSPHMGALGPVAPYGDWNHFNKAWGPETTELCVCLGRTTYLSQFTLTWKFPSQRLHFLVQEIRIMPSTCRVDARIRHNIQRAARLLPGMGLTINLTIIIPLQEVQIPPG